MRHAIRRSYRAVLWAAFLVLAAGRALRLRRDTPLEPSKVRRILVARMGLLGDGVLLTPALQTLRQSFPAADIDVVATPIQAPVFAPLPFADRVIVWDAGDLAEPRIGLRPSAWRRAAALVRTIRRERYDVAIAAYGPLASAIALASGAPFRVGFETEALPGTMTRLLHGGRYDRHWHDLVYNAALTLTAAQPDTKMGELPWDSVPTTMLVVDPEARAYAAEILRAHQRVALIHLGATNGQAKRWRMPHWAALCERMTHEGWTLVLIGADTDAPLSRELKRLVSGSVVDLVGKTSLAQLLAVIERADVVISGDSAPVHIGVALGRPTVAIHGPTDPVISGPADLRRAVVVRHPLPCSPCYRLGRVADCPLGHTLCQWLVTPDQVHDAVRDVVGRAVTAAA